MGLLTIAAVQATYVLMDRDATIDRVDELTAAAAARGCAARRVSRGLRSRNADLDRHAADLGRRRRMVRACSWRTRSSSRARQPIGWRRSPRSTACGWSSASRSESRHGSTIYNTVLYFSPDGRLVDRHRKLVPTGSERTVWGMGDGSTLAGGGHAARPDRWADLLGELHAPRPVPPLRARRRRLAGADARPGRWLDRDHAAPGAGEPDVRRRGEPGPARRPDPCRLPRPRPPRARRASSTEHGPWIEPGNTVIVGPAVTCSPARAGGRRDARRRARPRRGRGRSPLHGPDRPLQPTRHLPAAGRHDQRRATATTATAIPLTARHPAILSGVDSPVATRRGPA